MKKAIKIILGGVLVLGISGAVAGCGNSEGKETTTNANKTVTREGKSDTTNANKTVTKEGKSDTTNENKTVTTERKPNTTNENKTVTKEQKPDTTNENKTVTIEGKPDTTNENKTVTKEEKPDTTNENKTVTKEEKPDTTNENEAVTKEEKPETTNENKTVTREEKQGKSEKPKEIEVIEVDVAKVLDIFESNEVKGNKLYKDKRLRITGVIDNIEHTDTFGEYYTLSINKGEQFELVGVRIKADMDFEDDLIELVKGESITVIVDCKGVVAGLYVDAELVEIVKY